MQRDEPDPSTLIYFNGHLQENVFYEVMPLTNQRFEPWRIMALSSWHVHSCTSPVSPAGDVVKSVIHLSVSEILERMSEDKSPVRGFWTNLGRHQTLGTRSVNKVVECDVSRAAILLNVIYTNGERVVGADGIATFFEDNFRRASLLKHRSTGLLCMSKEQLIEVRAYLSSIYKF